MRETEGREEEEEGWAMKRGRQGRGHTGEEWAESAAAAADPIG